MPLHAPFFLFQLCSDVRAVLHVANKVSEGGLRQLLNFIPWLSHSVVSGVSSAVVSRVGFSAVQGWQDLEEPREAWGPQHQRGQGVPTSPVAHA